MLASAGDGAPRSVRVPRAIIPGYGLPEQDARSSALPRGAGSEPARQQPKLIISMSTVRVNRGLQRRSASRHGGKAHKSKCVEPRTRMQAGHAPFVAGCGGGKQQTVKHGVSTKLPTVLIDIITKPTQPDRQQIRAWTLQRRRNPNGIHRR